MKSGNMILGFMTATIIFAFVVGIYGQQKLVPVPIEVPKPGYEGTPVDLSKIPNVEKAASRRGPFLAPAGVKNVAEGKRVTSSESNPLSGDLSMITDGDATQWDGNFVELGPGKQWVQIDLNAPQEIYGILIWRYYQPRVYFCTVVQTAEDEAFTKNVKTWFNNDANNKLGLGAGQNQNYVESNEGKLIDLKGVTARYVRLYSAGNNTNTLNHYIEVAVYGRPPA
jgi:hypothetical protein